MYYVIRNANNNLVCTNDNSLGAVEFSDPDRQECLEYIYIAEKREAQAEKYASGMITACGIAALIFLALVLAGCAGRDANPVMSRQMGDNDMSCTAIRTEMAFIEEEINRLIPESKKTGKNVALGVAGWFVLVPWFFMDFSDAEKQEIHAYRQRYNTLMILGDEKGCAKVQPST